MEKKKVASRALTITITDYDDGSQSINYDGNLKHLETIGICEHLRVNSLIKIDSNSERN